MLSILVGLVGTLHLVCACGGPAPKEEKLALDVDLKVLTRTWKEGPRKVADQAHLRKSAKRFAERLFQADPMPQRLRAERRGSVAMAEALGDTLEQGKAYVRGRHTPEWADGISRPPETYGYELPRKWPIEIQRGETLGLLSQWSGSDPGTIRDDNPTTFKRRKWLRVGDRLALTMSATQKMVFEQARGAHRSERLEAYFKERYIEKVVLYVVRRGDSLSRVAKRYGEVPTWLLEDFNHVDFRALHAGDEILIPVVKTRSDHGHIPPMLTVVDERGRAISERTRSRLEGRFNGDMVGRARLVMDDSNVFERPSDQSAARRGGIFPGRTDVLPSAHVDPRHGGRHGAWAQVAPAAPPVETLEPTTVREVVIRSGETLSHYANWASVSVEDILTANPTLRPNRIRAGDRIRLPLSESAWVAFIVGRSGVAEGRPLVASSPSSPSRMSEISPVVVPSSAPRRLPVAAIRSTGPTSREHVIVPGDTGLALARKYGLGLDALARLNPGRDLNRIRVGERLRVR